MATFAPRLLAIASTSRARTRVDESFHTVRSSARRVTFHGRGLINPARATGEGAGDVPERSNNDRDDDDRPSELSPMDMRILQERMQSIREQEAALDVLRVVVLDASVPRQVLPLTFDASNTRRKLNAGTWLGEDVQVGDRFGMLGQAPSNGQILPNGVVVTVNRIMMKPSGESLVELIAGQRFAIVGSPFEDEAKENAPSARVRWIEDHLGAGAQTVEGVEPNEDDVDPSACDESSKLLALELPELVAEWKALVITKKKERQPDQLKLIMSHLGPMPSVDRPAELACWIAGLINPIPALGVAYEIRPALLCAPTVGDMIRVVSQGIRLSIDKLRGAPEM